MKLILVASILGLVGCAHGNHTDINRTPRQTASGTDTAKIQSAVSFIQSKSSIASDRPVLCFIPGGPGLSSATLRSMDILSRSFDLAFIDPPGTGMSPGQPLANFKGSVQSMSEAIARLNRPVILAGHSFGGVYAAAIAMSGHIANVAGLIFIDSPLSPDAWAVAVEQYKHFAGPDYPSAKEAYEQTLSDETFKAWMISSYRMFFRAESADVGKALLNADRMNWKLSHYNDDNPSHQPDFMVAIAKLEINKVTIAGEEDLIMPAQFLRQQADRIGSKFFLIKRAAHFPTLDRPKAVAKVIENSFEAGR